MATALYVANALWASAPAPSSSLSQSCVFLHRECLLVSVNFSSRIMAVGWWQVIFTPLHAFALSSRVFVFITLSSSSLHVRQNRTPPVYYTFHSSQTGTIALHGVASMLHFLFWDWPSALNWGQTQPSPFHFQYFANCQLFAFLELFVVWGQMFDMHCIAFGHCIAWTRCNVREAVKYCDIDQMHGNLLSYTDVFHFANPCTRLSHAPTAN